MINIFFKKKIIKKVMTTMLLFTHFSCYISLAAEMNADNLTYLTDNIVAWKNIDNANIVLANGQDISNLATKKEIEIQEEEEEILISNKLDLCLILDCSASMSKNERMNKLKLASKNLLSELGKIFQVRVTLITYGLQIKYGERMKKEVFYSEGASCGGRIELKLEQDKDKIFETIDNLSSSMNTPTGEAIEFAKKCWNDWNGEDSIIKKTVLITDGEPNRRCPSPRCITVF